MYGKTSKISYEGGLILKHHLNVKIIEAITESEYEKPVKDFLLSALLIEFENMNIARPRVKDDYEALIKKGAANMRGQK